MQDVIELGTDETIITILKSGVEIEDRPSGAVDEATCLTMRDGVVIATDQIQRQINDHSNTAETAALEQSGAIFRCDFGPEF